MPKQKTIIGATLALGVAIALISRNLNKQDPNQLSRKKQDSLVTQLSKHTYESYEEQKTKDKIAERIQSQTLDALTAKQKEALIRIIDGFLMTYSRVEFDEYLRFKQSQGSGHYSDVIATNGMDTLTNWRNRWAANNSALRQLIPNLPPTFKQRIVSFDATSIEIDVRKLYGTNIPARQISAPTNYTGSAILRNDCFVYDVNPETLSESNQPIQWATWKFPCYTEVGNKPGFVVISAYWNEPAETWTIHGGTSAMPPIFIPLL